MASQMHNIKQEAIQHETIDLDVPCSLSTFTLVPDLSKHQTPSAPTTTQAAKPVEKPSPLQILFTPPVARGIRRPRPCPNSAQRRPRLPTSVSHTRWKTFSPCAALKHMRRSPFHPLRLKEFLTEKICSQPIPFSPVAQGSPIYAAKQTLSRWFFHQNLERVLLHPMTRPE